MPRFAYLKVLVPVLILAGCKADTVAKDEREPDIALAESIHHPEVNGAILAQHTLYPYHFDSQSAALNGLGRRDLGVLAGHFRTNSGEMNVRQGAASRELYNARVQSVLVALTDAGVDAGHVSIADGLPGGDGLSSAEVVVRIEAARKSGGAGTLMGTGDSSSSSSSSSSNSPMKSGGY